MNLGVLKPKQDNNRSEYPHSYENDDDNIDDYDYEEVPKNQRLHWLYNLGKILQQY